MAVPKGTRVGGRQKGTLNKATRDIRDAAQEYSEKALKALVGVMTSSDSDAARVAAANAILDRAHGKPAQALKVGGDEDGVPIETVMRWASTPAEAKADPSERS